MNPEVLQFATAMRIKMEDKVSADWQGEVLFAGVTGSHAYGLSTPSSDVDVRCLHAVNPLWLLKMLSPISPSSPQSTINLKAEGDVESTELGKFAHLAVKGNPTLLEFLFLPEELIEFWSDVYEEMRDNRKAFLGTKTLTPRYIGYAAGQFFRMVDELKQGEWFKREILSGACKDSMDNAIETILSQPAEWDKVVYDCKNLMHNLRLLKSVEHALKYGDLLVNVGEYKDELQAIRFGQVPINEALIKIREQMERVRAAENNSVLPPDPDEDLVEDIIVRYRLGRLGLWG